MESIHGPTREKREYTRIDLETQVSIRSIHAGPRAIGWIEDISRGGFKVRADIPLNFKGLFDEGDQVLFETHEDFFKLRGRGKIRWTSAEKGEVGIKFDALDDKSRKSLEEFLSIFT